MKKWLAYVLTFTDFISVIQVIGVGLIHIADKIHKWRNKK